MRAYREHPWRRLPQFLATVAVLAVAGCGATEPSGLPKSAASPVAVEATVSEPATATQPKPTTKRSEAAASSKWTACDANIDALRPHTSCPFAQNAFYEYWASDGDTELEVYSPAVDATFTTRCTDQGFSILCRTDDGGQARFSSDAVANYDAKQAGAYAETHDTGTDSTSATADYAEPDASDAGVGDYDAGGGYDDTDTYDDSNIYDGTGLAEDGSDTADDSSTGDLTGDEIPNYDNGTGYRVQCADGMYSQSGGKQGACSGHGGVG